MGKERGRDIGGVAAASPIWLAPIAGVTTETYRSLHARLGAALVHTEMISAAGLSRNNAKTARMIGGRCGVPTVLQIFGPDAEVMTRGAEAALVMGRFDAIEINMACPMPKVTRKSGGASLLHAPAESCRMVAGLKRFGLPVWAKIRKTEPGHHPLSTGDFVSALIEAGAGLIIVHGRTPSQRYEGAADKDAVTAMAAKFPGMISASGDFYAPDDAKAYLDGGCVSVLAARGAMRDVFLIPKTLSSLGFPTEEKYLNMSPPEQINLLAETVREAVKNEGERFAAVMARKLLSGMLKGVRGAARLREDCASHRDWPSLEKALTAFAIAE
ncbi:MAG: tRNA-dihydrouridine synthase family protein [Synergistaceae bacterium]|jgi:tRNA-dihydrouridine synthase B|nr:tRNA-dihydrouridine synthase family protein [Synergistaceae bacterium]